MCSDMCVCVVVVVWGLLVRRELVCVLPVWGGGGSVSGAWGAVIPD